MAPDDKDKRKKPGTTSAAPLAPEFQRHCFGGVVHDERGVATLLWAPESNDDTAQRRALTIAPEPGANPGEPRRKPKDLRKLGEWIKLQREIAARKQKG